MRQLLMSLSFLLPAIAAAYDYPSPPPPPQGETVPLLSFKSSDEANAAFKPFIPGTPEVEMDGDRIVLPINFKGTRHLRVCWDVPFKFDMTPYDRMECDFYIASSAIASRAHIYFHSVNGWYFRHLDELKPNQWNHIVLKRKDLLAESTPEGWHRTDGLRFGIWRDDTFNEDTFAILANFRLMRQKANVAIIRYDNEIINGLNSDSKREFVREKIFSDNVETCLNRIGMTYSYISDFDLDRESLFKHKLIILPYNRRISAEHAALYEEFVAQGGKILAFYALTPPLDKLLGLKGGRNISAPGGRFTGMFSTERGFPPFTRQSSWCYIDLKITDERNKVVATWQDAKGNRTDIPAVVLSPNGAFITHVCLGDGMDAKPKLIMEIISRLVPEVLADCAARMLDNPGLKGADGIDNFEMFQRKFANEQDADLQKACHAALEFHQRAQEQFKLANFPESIACSGAAMDKAMETWARSKRSKPNEVRGIWCHDAPGLPGKTWDESIRIIADAGLNRIYPNMLWAMQAGYPSKVLDSMPGCGTPETDQMRQCLDACHKYGVECHVWKVSWIDIKNNPNITEKYKKEGRLQVRLGEKIPYSSNRLCPSDLRNIQLEIDAMLELVRNYPDIDGIHFDNIRYSDSQACYCDGCKERFAKVLGTPLDNWPNCCVAKGKYYSKWIEFRCANINKVVETVQREARKINPKLKISAAVFTNYPMARINVGQDWKKWLDDGWVDFVCPMNYTSDNSTFRSQINKEIRWVGKSRLYPGMSAT